MGAQPEDIEAVLAQDDVIVRALRKAVRRAVRRHWDAGHPVAEWRDGRVVWIDPKGSVVTAPRRRRSK